MTMHIRVQYDARTRTFKLMDEEYRTLLEGDALYDLSIPFTFEQTELTEVISTSAIPVAHA
jgi:hypothetical protein